MRFDIGSQMKFNPAAPAIPRPPPRHALPRDEPRMTRTNPPQGNDNTPEIAVYESVVRCIASFGETSGSAPNSHSHRQTTHLPPPPETRSFNISHLSAFCRAKRRSPAEFSYDLITRMLDAASPTQIVDAEALQAVATASDGGPYAADWQRVIRMALTHITRSRHIEAHKRETIRRQEGLIVRPITAATHPVRTHHIGRTQSARKPVPAHTLKKEADEFRHSDGSRRLQLPVLEHPFWSRHANGYSDVFDELRCDASGRSLASIATESLKPPHTGRSNTSQHRQIFDCGREVVLGTVHKNVARGGTVVDLSRLANVQFNPYFSDHTYIAGETLPLSAAMTSRRHAVPPSIIQVADADTQRRIEASIAAVLQYVDSVAR